jgi:hypothetical protein
LTEKFPTRQAVVVIHGIGEELPMQTVRSFVDAVVTTTNATGQKFWNRPDRMSDSFELRRLTAPGDGASWPLTDYFEYYWAANMRDTTWREVLGWLGHLLFTPGSKIPPRLRWVWRTSQALVALGLALAVVASFAVASLGAHRFVGYTVLASLFTFAVTGVLDLIFLGYIGDAARYLSPKPENIAQRTAIRRDGVELIRRLHASGKYGRIIVVGHSLGSVIAYDILRFVFDELRNEKPAQQTTEREGTLKAMRELIAAGVGVDPHDSAYPAAAAEFVKRFRGLQMALWRAERETGSGWLVTDLITCGSPLAHASLLMADSEADLIRRETERELPTCPPRSQGTEDPLTYVKTSPEPPDDSASDIPVLHTSAVFACVRWTNLYFRADFIGGPVAPVFGAAVHDEIVEPERSAKADGARMTLAFLKGYTPLSHGMYWQMPSAAGTRPPMRWDGVHRIRAAMALDATELLTFAQKPPAEKP